MHNARQEQDLSLRDIAQITGRHHSVYGKMEQGRRRIDVVEFVEYCHVLNVNPQEGLNVIIKSLNKPNK